MKEKPQVVTLIGGSAGLVQANRRQFRVKLQAGETVDHQVYLSIPR